MILMIKNTAIETKLLSSLAKVFSDEELTAESWDKGSMLSNEVYSFQVAYHCVQESGNVPDQVNIRVKSELSPYTTLRKVTLIQSDLPCYEDHDENVLRTTTGLYPDLLRPLINSVSLTKEWQSIWITVDPQGQIKADNYPVKLLFETQEGEVLASEVFHITIIDNKLPKQTLINTEWFHTDCIATWYGDDVFCEAHWKRIEQFVKTAVNHGINMILTPLFTPPLDTKVGGERPTVQLVSVEKSGDNYKFTFDRLDRWTKLCKANGVEYFEFSHLFTQWGAKHAPKIIATVNGELKQIFGWDTDAAGAEYESFLDQFLPVLVSYIKANDLEKCSYFHISDEPSEDHLESYENASRILNKHLADFPIIDALSSYTFYEKGLVKRPIPASNHIEPFLQNKVPDLWTYYCCGQYKQVSNRFFNMPSARNRIIGVQLYKYNIAGFLQWGYNFWYSQYSIHPIDPFKVTDAGKAFPSGDAFTVYPGEDGPLESIRLEVFYEALQDLRALKHLEELVGRDTVIKLLEDGLETPITFTQYPKDAQWLLNKREEINQMISENR